MQPRSNSAAAIFTIFVATLGGCDGCPGGKPYTPYTLTDQPAAGTGGGGDGGAPPSGAAASSVERGAGAAPLFTPIPASPAPGEGTSWALDPGVTAVAPAGRVLSLGLLLDADGDGKRDLLAWSRAPDGLRGELIFASGARPSEGRTIAALPGDLSTQGCTARTSLAQVGPRSAAFDFAPQCPGSARLRASRWIAVLRFGAQGGDGAQGGQATAKAPELALEMRIGPLPFGEELAITVDTRDRDGDARDDIAATISLSGALRPFSGAVGPYPSAPTVSAQIAFFDRPAGLSRDPSEPEASLAAFAGSLLADARKKETAPRVAPAVHQLRRLRSILCEESGRPIVTTGAGPIRCGDPRSLEEASFAEATAAFTKGSPARALVAIGRFDALPSPTDARKNEIRKLLSKGAPATKFELLYRASAVPSTDRAPGLGPLTFDAGGDLLVRTDGGVVRIDRTTFAETPTGIAAWSSVLASEGAGAGDVWVLASIEQACETPTLAAIVQKASAPPADPAGRMTIALPVLAPVTPRGLPGYGRCGAIPTVVFTPIGTTAEHGLVVAVGPELIGIKNQAGSSVVSLVDLPLPPFSDPGAGPPGTARSPDGATVALPTSRGLLVVSAGSGARLWSGPDLVDAASCTPSSGGARVACVGGGSALLYEAR